MSASFAGRVVNADFEVAAAGAVPEPATWSTMILSFGLAGGVLRRRRSAGGVAIA